MAIIPLHFSLRGLRRLGGVLLNRPGMILSIILLGWLAWAGWTAWSTLPDQLLPPERITAKQLRVNAAQYTTLQTNLTKYHQPPTTTISLPVNKFAAPPAP